MKKALLTLALIALATFANAQGTIQFANNAGTRFNVDGARPLNAANGGPAANTYTFGVFVGTSADSISTQAAGPLGGNTATGGLITAPSPNAYQLAGTEAGATVFVQFRAWSAVLGSDWQAAKAGAGYYGESDIRQVTLGPTAGPGTVVWSSSDLTKFQSINLTIVPEPTTIALGVLGLGSLLLFRRRK